jgi:serine/threonine protein kinase
MPDSEKLIPNEAAFPPTRAVPNIVPVAEAPPLPSGQESSGETPADGSLPNTVAIPTYFAPISPSMPPGSSGRLRSISLEPAPPIGEWGPGLQFDDFKMVRLLGKGAFGRVLLAQQLSLDRLVALKVTANSGQEGRTLASLEHEHIVQVFSENFDAATGVRWLAMQYVPGTHLAKVIHMLNFKERSEWTGQLLLDIIDSLSQQAAPFHPAALRDRQVLAEANWVEAVCWLTARLAEALDYAHSRGVLHRDIKPANILINQYGRPFLADFNLATRPQPAGATDGDVFGGTLAYMAPEHLEAVDSENEAARRRVDERADIYALGFVSFELLTGQMPFGNSRPLGEPKQMIRALADIRRSCAPSARGVRPDVPPAVDAALRRGLDPNPDQRYQTGREMAQALEGCRELERLGKTFPKPGRVTEQIGRHPFLWLAVLVLAPQILGSIVNVVYNNVAIVADLTPPQQSAFLWLVLIYNLLVYPLCLAQAYRLVMPVLRAWQTLTRRPPADLPPLDPMRRVALTWPMWVVWLSCLGWLPGALLFPICLALFEEPISLVVFGHFLVSFTFSGLITLTYSYFAVQYVVLRILYLLLWHDASGVQSSINRDLSGIDRRLRLFQLLAGLIPLIAAALIVAVSPEVSGDRALRVLLTALLGLSMAGFGMALFAHNALANILTLLVTGSKSKQ